jgi:general secretion pathway protein H
MSVPGNDALGARSAGVGARGFTLIELMIVVALIAIASAVAVVALRDPSSTQLEREGARLAALLESARVEARTAGVAVLWVPGASGEGFRFVGLPAALALPTRWLDGEVTAEIRSEQGAAKAAVLGPEPVIGAQRITLRLASRSLTLATDGMGPFTRADDDAPAGNAPR